MSATTQIEDRPADDAVDDTADEEQGPRERLSWARLGMLIVIIGMIGGGIAFVVRAASSQDVPTTRSWSIPYVDVTLTPTYEFQNPQSNPARDIALAFVVADPTDPCTPTWGGAYTLDKASEDLELDRRITQLRAAGGDVMVSFGGQANAELAFACADPTSLAAAYRTVIERYDVRSIDLDIENADLADTPSIGRRAEAIATVQKERATAGKKLAVWITLPVATTGLTPDGAALVKATIAGGVDVTGVNAMTMNFGSAEHPTKDMLAATKSALEASARQVAEIYGSQGVTLDETQRWAHLGATPMIGQNDVKGEVFTLADASGLAAFATTKGLGRVGFWSLNRDSSCSTSFTDVMVLSNTCSSVQQDALQFANVFTSLSASDSGNAVSVTVPDRQQVADDPTTSPFPIWRPEAKYPAGYKVVRGGQVYQAKWYTQDPTATVVNAWETPWTLVGPVSPSDAPFTPSTLAPGTDPPWQPDHLYAKGDRVLFDGLPFEARWPSQGEAPPTLFPVGPDAGWSPLFTIAGEPPGT